jgi:hypothetical protein
VRTTVTLVADVTDAHEDAVIEAPSATPVREILMRLGDLVGVPSDTVAKIDGRAVDDGRAMSPLGGSALREGVIVSFDTTRRHQARNDRPSSYLELAAPTVSPRRSP